MRLAIGLAAAVIALSVLLVAMIFGDGWRGLLPRGEITEVPEDDERALSREEMREALLTALSSPAVVGRRLEAMSKRKELKDLHKLPAELEPLYVQEADR